MRVRRVIRKHLRRQLRDVDLAVDANLSVDVNMLERPRRRPAEAASAPQDEQGAEARPRDPPRFGGRD